MESLENNIYKIYGLIMQSQIKLNELIKFNCSDKNIDINVKLGEMDKEIMEEISLGKKCCFKKDISWFVIKNVGIYKIINGKEIIIHDLGGSLNNLKSFLLGSALGTLLIQRNILAIHGGTILLDNKAVTITGESGAGKSTLLSAFRLKGYKFLADDVSTVNIKNNNIVINPAYPQQKLCEDSIKKLGIDKNNLVLLDEFRKKYAIPALQSFIENEKEFLCIVEISVGDVKEVIIEEKFGIDKLKVVMNNIYRIEIAQYIGLKGAYLNNIIKIAGKIKVLKLIRPKGAFTVDDQINKIQQCLVGELTSTYGR